jgi:hypothetical protein
VYATGRRTPAPGPATQLRPKTPHSDGEILEAIRACVATCPFRGEGYRKMRARLAHSWLHFGGKRALPLLRAHGLLAPPSQSYATEMDTVFCYPAVQLQ